MIKKLNKYWLIVQVLNMVVAFINPYISYFAMVNGVLLFICFIWNIIFKEKIKKYNYIKEKISINDKNLRQMNFMFSEVRSLKFAMYFLAVFCFVCNLFANSMIAFVSLSTNQINIIINFDNIKIVGIILFMISMILNLLSAILLISYAKNTKIEKMSV